MKTPSRLVGVLLVIAALALFAAALSLRPPVRSEMTNNRAQPAGVHLSGEQARVYLEQRGEDRSLAEALAAARFGLAWQEPAPDGRSGGEYFGQSHEQNLMAWFGREGVTVQPTLFDQAHQQTWTVALNLKAWGFGKNLVEAPPIVSRVVKENRIDYERAPIIPHSAFRNPQLTEWYENRAEGIEQGFILNERPLPGTEFEPNESLRILLAVSGDLKAHLAKDGDQIELGDETGKGALSYSKLVAWDADGKSLAARMEVIEEGKEIALVVEEANARYPIVIDPFIASLEQKLRSDVPQADARFGTAVAIDGNLAVVGAWREDVGANADVGAVYVFVRTGIYPNSSWALDKRFNSASGAGQQCGFSVAIHGNRIAFGCPGENSGAGLAFVAQRNGPSNYSSLPLIPDASAPLHAGDGFGTTVAVSNFRAYVGAPFVDYFGKNDAGSVSVFAINANFTVAYDYSFEGPAPNGHYGAGLAVETSKETAFDETLVVGAPGLDYVVSEQNCDAAKYCGNEISHAPAGTQFGQSVAISGDTLVVGAFADDEKGTDAGAAYVYVRDNTGRWNSPQQKLTASDASPNNYFSVSAVAIQDDTILVGAYAWDGGAHPFILSDDDRGAAYVFTRTGTVWTQKTQIIAGDGERGDNFGISVGLSGDSAIIGSRHATAVGTAAAGAAYVYKLPHRLGNIATRLRVETRDNTLIGGFIVTGTQDKKVIVRAIGPSLTLADKLSNPTLELYQGSNRIAINDNWVDSADKQAIINSGVAPTNDLESAIIMSLPANNSQYTAVVRGLNNGTGTAVVEVYDLDNTVDSKLANISTRGLVQTGDNVLFAGTIVVGDAPQKVIIRALGPSVPVAGRMSDPTLDLYDSNGAVLESNDNWVDSPNKQAIIDSGIPPNHDLESAIVRTLPLGTYTAIVRGFAGSTGVAVVEVYVLN